jgi:hypothetical protein
VSCPARNAASSFFKSSGVSRGGSMVTASLSILPMNCQRMPALSLIRAGQEIAMPWRVPPKVDGAAKPTSSVLINLPRNGCGGRNRPSIVVVASGAPVTCWAIA